MDGEWQTPTIKLRPLLSTQLRLRDIGYRIQVTIAHEDHNEESCQDYVGEHYGHGNTKTAFLLHGAPGDPFHGKILKVTDLPDTEPAVFADLAVRCPGTTSNILYKARGVLNPEHAYYCWITERTIPLVKFLSDVPEVLPEKCILAAMLCMARCAMHGLQLREGLNHFGVLVNSQGQHVVIAIDSGLHELGDRDCYSKSFCNDKLACNIWKHARQVNAHCKSVQDLWRDANTLPDAIANLENAWKEDPYLSTSRLTTLEIEAQMQM